MVYRQIKIVLCCLPLWLCGVLPGYALDLSATSQIHGFASQAYILTSDNNFFGSSSDSDGSWDYTEIGINGSVRPWSKLQLSAQAISRHAGAGEDNNLRLDYGFVDYSLVESADNSLGLRLGRVKNPYGLYGETRGVPHTRPSIFMPQSIYFDRSRNVALSSDGVYLYGEHRATDNTIMWQFGQILMNLSDEVSELTLLGGNRAGELDANKSYLGRVMYEREGGWLRAAVTAGQLNLDYDAAPSDPLQEGSIQFEPIIFSLQYNSERWSLTSEYAARRFHYQDFGPAIPDMDFTGVSYYFQSAYRFTTNWEGVARYDVYCVDRTDCSGEDYAALTGRPAYRRYAHDAMIGVRWDAMPWLMLRAEYHVIEGVAWLPPLDNPNPATAAKYWDMFALQASVRF